MDDNSTLENAGEKSSREDLTWVCINVAILVGLNFPTGFKVVVGYVILYVDYVVLVVTTVC